MVFIYILKLENNKYYVGKTNNPHVRLHDHFNSKGSGWTKKYKPLEVIKVISDCDDYDEDKFTRQYMDKYGIDNVRGGSFVSIKLNKQQINVLTHMGNGTNNRCFNCGETGHFSKDCLEKYNSDDSYKCFYCNKKFITYLRAKFYEYIYCKKEQYSIID